MCVYLTESNSGGSGECRVRRGAVGAFCAATIIITGKFSNSSQHKSLEMSAIKSSLRMQREANKRMRQHIDIPKAGDDYLPRLRVDEELDVAMIHH